MHTPELEHDCNSWVVTRKADRSVIGEFYERKNVEKFNHNKCNVETALQYLQRINREIKELHV